MFILNEQKFHNGNRLGVESMKTRKLKIRIIEYLAVNGPQTTNQIQDHINCTTRHGTTSQQLGNVLSKNKDFKKAGTALRAGILSGSYEVVVWDLVKE